MSPIDDTIAHLDALIESTHDRRTGGNPAAPSVTMQVTVTRDRLLFETNGVQVWTVTSDTGTARGLVWVEHAYGWEVISSSQLRELYPEVERRTDDAAATRVTENSLIGGDSDRRAA